MRKIYSFFSILSFIIIGSQTMCPVTTDGVNGQGMIIYSGDVTATPYINNGEAPNNYASFFTASNIRSNTATTGFSGITELGDLLNGAVVRGLQTYFRISDASSSYTADKNLNFVVNMTANSPIIRLNAIRIGTLSNSSGNSATNWSYNFKVEVIDNSTSAGTVIIVDEKTPDSGLPYKIFTLAQPYNLQPNKSYTVKISFRMNNTYSDIYVDNPTFYALAVPTVVNSVGCISSTATVGGALSGQVNSGTPKNMQLRWFRAGSDVTTSAYIAGTYTPYYYNGTCYHPAGTAMTVSSSVAAPVLALGAATCASAGSATISNYNATNINYTFNPTGPTISASGLINGLIAGMPYAVTATQGTCTASTNFTVQSQFALPTISGPSTVCVGSQVQLTGSPTAATTNPWVSSNTGVATVNNSGLVTGISAGTTTITYTNSNGCSATLTFVSTQCSCYNPANTGSAGTNTNHGITLQKRAGADSGNWPMIRRSAHTVLESNTKGFVITRVPTSGMASIIKPQEGMMVYDTTAKCLKIFSDGIWSCFNQPACP